MAPLVHLVLRQSRTLRDVIVMSCMLDLERDDVSTALDLVVARVEALLRGALSWFRIGVGWPGRMRLLAPIVLRSGQRLRTLLPMLVLVAWFALPMSAVAGACAALVSLELHGAGP